MRASLSSAAISRSVRRSVDEQPVDPADGRPPPPAGPARDDAVRLEALLLAARELRLRRAVLVDQLRRKPVARRSALAEAELDQPALALEDLRGQLAAVLAGHRALHALDDRRDRAAVVLELLGAVDDADAGALADVLVVGALVGVLEAAPPADVVDEDAS